MKKRFNLCSWILALIMIFGTLVPAYAQNPIVEESPAEIIIDDDCTKLITTGDSPNLTKDVTYNQVESIYRDKNDAGALEGYHYEVPWKMNPEYSYITYNTNKSITEAKVVVWSCDEKYAPGDMKFYSVDEAGNVGNVLSATKTKILDSYATPEDPTTLLWTKWEYSVLNPAGSAGIKINYGSCYKNWVQRIEHVTLLHKEVIPTVNLEAVSSKYIPSNHLFNVSLFASSDAGSAFDKLAFDLKYDPSVMTLKEEQYLRKIKDSEGKYTIPVVSFEDKGNGIIHVDLNCTLNNKPAFEYSATRMIQFVFESANINDKKNASVTFDNIKATMAGKDVKVNTSLKNYDMEFLPEKELDYNGDGRIGAGDVSLAPEGKKAEVASVSAIYPYKRAIALTMDGAGLAFSVDKKYFQESKNVLPYVTDEIDPKLRDDNCYAMKLINDEFAISYSASATLPPISAHNYSTMLHGIPWKKLPKEYQRDNDNSKWYLWSDFGKEKPLYPSLFKVAKDENPDMKFYALSEWPNITNGLLEQDTGIYLEECKTTDPFNETWHESLAQYANDGRLKGTTISYIQSSLMDYIGHSYGFYIPFWYENLKKYDDYFKTVVDALKANGLYEDSLLLLNCDHGGNKHSHYQENIQSNLDIMFGFHGQTVPEGERLYGGNNVDLPAVIFAGLRLSPDTSSMIDSKVFDKNVFLSQEEMYKKGRDIEKITFKNTGNSGIISLSNKKAKNITTADFVMNTKNSEIIPAEGIKILRNEIKDGKQYVTLSGNMNNGKIADVKLSESDAKLCEIMLGAEDGTEIYCDLDNTVKNTKGVSINRENIDLEVNETAKLTATDDVIWESSSDEIATVENGKVTAKSEGTATIIATSGAYGTKALCTVTVRNSSNILKGAIITELDSMGGNTTHGQYPNYNVSYVTDGLREGPAVDPGYHRYATYTNTNEVLLEAFVKGKKEIKEIDIYECIKDGEAIDEVEVMVTDKSSDTGYRIIPSKILTEPYGDPSRTELRRVILEKPMVTDRIRINIKDNDKVNKGLTIWEIEAIGKDHIHSFTPWTTRTFPTENRKGLMVRECPICQLEETKSIAEKTSLTDIPKREVKSEYEFTDSQHIFRLSTAEKGFDAYIAIYDSNNILIKLMKSQISETSPIAEFKTECVEGESYAKGFIWNKNLKPESNCIEFDIAKIAE